MGYTHYWSREKEINEIKFKAIVHDFKILLPKLKDAGVLLANGIGIAEPEINFDFICFNGLKNCGHPKNSAIMIPWPTANAGGIASAVDHVKGISPAGHWFAGAEIDQRVCNGSCDYETFYISSVKKIETWDKPNKNRLWFDCCKTAFRPYDLAVTACLIICKHHLENRFEVSSDGKDQHWFDAKLLCKLHLGYGMDFKLDR